MYLGYCTDFAWLRSPCSFVDALPHGVESLRVSRPCELDGDGDELPTLHSAQRAADLIVEREERERGNGEGFIWSAMFLIYRAM